MRGASLREALKPRGRVEIFITRGAPKLVLGERIPRRKGRPPLYKSESVDLSGCELLDHLTFENIIVNAGKDKVIEALSNGQMHLIARMAIGDNGTIPSDSTSPKTPLATRTGLYHEVYRADVESSVLDVGGDKHEVRFVKTFSAADVPITAFANQAMPVVNEVGLITVDPEVDPDPRADVAAPATPPADEALYAMRTFKSVPFEAADDVAITVRYTIYIE